MRALLCLAALLALTGAAFATLGDNGMTTYTGRKRGPNTVVFGNPLILDITASSTLKFAADLVKGTFKPTPNAAATEKKEVFVECLNSVAPPPLNWKMWCPSDAKIYQWIDKSGATHRQITIRPQEGMTSTMYIWWIVSHLSGILPPVTEYEGNHYYYYHLWHPLDHVESAWSFGPKNPLTQKGLPLYAYIHERYRTVNGSKSDKSYETNGWFFADDAIANVMMKNRFVITMPLLGMPTFTMIIEFNDHHEGLVVDIEMIAGLPFKNYDEQSPLRGYLTAAGLNEMATAPTIASGAIDWDAAFDAITRHAIEEFTNLQFFVPYFWKKYTALGKAGVNWYPTLGTWQQHHKFQVNDGLSISFYHALTALSNSLINKSHTPVAKAADAAVAAANATYQAKTDAATAAFVAKSQVYVQPSNAVTKFNYEKNAASGPHPEMAHKYGVVQGNQTVAVTVDKAANSTKPLEILQAALKAHLLHNSSANSTLNVTFGPGPIKEPHAVFVRLNHTFGK